MKGWPQPARLHRGLNKEANDYFSWMLTRSGGRSDCGVKPSAEAYVKLQNDGAQSLTATGRKHVNTLTDACCIERL